MTLTPRRSPTGAQHGQGEDSRFLAAGFPWAAGPQAVVARPGLRSARVGGWARSSVHPGPGEAL